MIGHATITTLMRDADLLRARCSEGDRGNPNRWINQCKRGQLALAWANAHFPPALVTDSQLVRAFGEEHGISELSSETVEDDNLNALGWELTSVMARITNALGAYRPPRDEGGGLYLLYKRMAWAG